MLNQENIKFISAFIIVQKRKLIIIIIEVLRNQFILLFSSFDENNENFDDNDDFNIHCFVLIIRFTKNVEFFDSDYKDINNSVIVNVN